MANIAITGHTSGIGLGLLSKFQSESHTVIGFSRSNGHDLKNNDTIDNIINSLETNEIDTIVINAHWRFSQVNLLYRVADIWNNREDKTIITISSNSGDGKRNHAHQYAVEKTALDKASNQIAGFHSARILNVRPGYVDTPRVQGVKNQKIPVDRIADTIFWVWSMPRDCSITELTILPRKD